MVNIPFNACDEEHQVSVDLCAVDESVDVAGVDSLRRLKAGSADPITCFGADISAGDAHLDPVLLHLHLIAGTGSDTGAVVHHKVMWALFDAECSVCVFGPWVVLQLERGGVVDEGPWALGHTSAAVVEVCASEAVCVFWSRTASSTFRMATVTDVRPKTAAITLLRAHRLRQALTLVFLRPPAASITCSVTPLTGAAAVGWHNQVIRASILHYVLPVDGISMTQEFVLVHIHPSIQDFCEVLKAKLTEAKVSVSAVVEEDCQSISVFIQPGATDDAKILQGKIFKLIQCHEHIASHLTNGPKKRQVTAAINAGDLQIPHHHLTVLIVFTKGPILLVQI